MASSSSASPSTIQQSRYEVFLSFRGENTRQYFTSHLYAALVQRSIKTFIDDELCRGEEITTSLLEVIERSKIAVLVFSKDYASSPFCLDEVAKIMECHATHGQIVVPIFYHVDPSDVENQTGSFETAFANHSKICNFDRVKRWKSALNKAASMAGWDSKVFRSDAELVENIAKDILEKLNEEFSCDLEGLVGMHSRIQEIQELLSAGSQDVRFLGIWGMGGIGKTTLAEVVFKKIATQFEAYCFLEDVRENSEKHGRHHLIKEFLRQMSGESDVNINTTDIKCYYLGQRMLRKKLLVVIDDVNITEQLEFFVKNRRLLGIGSRIIATSRDKHVLLTSVDEPYIYEVKKLYHSEAMLLFSQNALKNSSLTRHYLEVAGSFTQYADGNPLALKVLGSFLFGKNQAEWSSALDRLRKAPNKDIQNVLRISYDSLDQEEKEIFLHIACFFIGTKWNEMIQMLDACGFSIDIGLRVLIDKSLIIQKKLIQKKHHYVQMHDLLKEMGKGIVCQESREPGKRSRLWNHEDIVRVLTENSGTEAIEAIYLRMTEINAIKVMPNIFSRMPNLIFLRFSCPRYSKDNKVRLPQGLEYFPNRLRYLHWEAYPAGNLPSNFRLMDLVELHLPCSKLKQLPDEIKDLKNLKLLDLSFSECLIEIPELSGAINLNCIKLHGCVRLISFPSGIGLKSLEILDLSSCTRLENFLEVPRNIKYLNLDGTAIKQLPLSIEFAFKLQNLSLKDCSWLKSLPRGMWKLKSLLCLNLANCSISDIIPEILESMDHSSALDRPTVQELSSLVENQKRFVHSGSTKLEELPEELIDSSLFNSSGCHDLSKLPSELCGLFFIEELNLTNCSVRTLPASIKQLARLRKLNINSCLQLQSLPDLPLSLEVLHLRFNQFEALPASIKLLSRLTLLDIIGCDRLQLLPDLPHSLKRINAYGCESLVMVTGLTHLFELEYENSSNEKMFIFSNCFKLDPKEWREFLADAKLVIQRSSTRWHMLRTRDRNKRCDRTMILHPGSETPAWLAYKSEGSSIDIPLQTHSNDCRFLGVALCLIISMRDFYWSCIGIRCEGNGIEYILCDTEFTMQANSDHAFLMYDPHFPFWDFVSGEYVSFRFCHSSNSRVKRCGMLPIYDCDNKCKWKW